MSRIFVRYYQGKTSFSYVTYRRWRPKQVRVFSQQFLFIKKVKIIKIKTDWLTLFEMQFILRIVEMTEDFSNVSSKFLKCSRIFWFLVNKQFKMPVIMVSTLVIISGFKASVKLSSYYSKIIIVQQTAAMSS